MRDVETRFHRATRLLFLQVTIGLLIIATPATSSALVLRSDNEAYVSEKIDDDLIIGGDDIKFDGEIRGDIIAAGMDIVIDGYVDGNVNAAGYNVKAGGTVLRSVRLAGYKVTADGKVLGNILLAGNIARISSTCEVQRSVSYTSPNKAEIADGAQIEGDLKWKREAKSGGESSSFVSFLKTVVLLLGAYVAGLVILWYCRPSFCNVRDIVKGETARSLGQGFVIVCVTPILIIFVLITIIGIPLGLLALLLYVCLFYVSKVFVAVEIGDWILSRLSGSESRSQALALLIGLILLTIAFEIPYLGWVFYFGSVWIGFGAIMIAFNRRRKAIAASPEIIEAHS
jgi:cytoskeletal protein CcmA (bactofilin family)